MNTLPEARRMLAGRTWASAWRAADADPIERPRGRPIPGADIALAVVIGLGLAATLIHWWAS